MDSSGFFPIEWEYKSIESGMEQWQKEAGTFVWWFQLDQVNSKMDPVYDEEDELGNSLAWKPPVQVPIYFAHPTIAPGRSDESGFYPLSGLHLVASYEQLEQNGLAHLATEANNHLRDRFMYRNNVYSVRNIQVEGQLSFTFNTTIGIDGAQMMAEELANDAAFLPYYNQFITQWSGQS